MEKQNEQTGSRKSLSLQQKMVEIRKMIPALTKQAYSGEVNYDFVKIDDIYRYLTPALNRYGVNLDIVSEKATRRDAQGNPVYVQYLPASQLWMYEMDLTLRWTDADNPEDADERTIHAIGTHVQPEKAKGCALTYALKYYLFNRFTIDQGAGGEDADMHAYRAQGDAEGEIEEGWENTHEDRDKNNAHRESKQGELEMDTGEFQNIGEEKTPFSEEKPEKQTFTPQCQNIREERETIKQAASDSKERTAAQIPPASSQIRPENGRMVTLPETTVGPAGMTLEEASQVICRCGTYRNWTLGRIAEEEDGVETLEWLANGYRGKDETMRQGAKVLLRAAKAA